MLRALLQPLAPTVLMWTGITAVMLSLLEQFPLLGLPGFVILASMTSKYAYVLLESAANGVAEPPPLAAEMLSPFEARPLLQLIIGVLVATLILMLHGTARAVAVVIALLLLPASVGVLGVSGPALDAANPLALARTIRSFGVRYFAILLVAAVYVAILVLAFSAPWWAVFRWTLLLLCVYSLYTLIGGTIHARRLELGFEPIHSPEREAERAASVARREAAHWYEELHGCLRAHNAARAEELLSRWAATHDDALVALQAPEIIDHALAWNNDGYVAFIASRLVTRLLRARNSAAALHVVGKVLPRVPALRLASDAEQFGLAQAARANGQRALSAALLLHFERHFPESHLLARAQALRAEAAR